MSLHTLANHMAARGRGPDSTLVHMSPREIQGLQSLAQAHGRSLTINPQTGLPEAGILEDILPSIAGFAIDAFAPGAGTAIGAAANIFGGSSSSKSSQNAPTGLASTSLERGLQAGLGTNTNIYEVGSKEISEKESPAGAFSSTQAAVDTTPKDYLKDNKYDMYSIPPYTSYGAVQHYASGGDAIGTVGAPVDASGKPIVIDPYDTRTDSQKAQDYLLGKPGAVNPFLFYHSMAAPEEIAKTTKDVSALDAQNAPKLNNEGHSLSQEQIDAKNDPKAWGNLTDAQKAEFYANNPNMASFQQGFLGLWGKSPISSLQEYFSPGTLVRNQLIAQGVDPSTGTHMSTSEQKKAALEAIKNPVMAPGDNGLAGLAEQYGMYGNERAGLSETPSERYSNPISGYSFGPAPSEASLSNQSSETRSSLRSNEGYGDGGGEANGGLMNSHYAHGGIAALAGGGMYNLGSYSDGGRLLRGPGDGVSDDIPATIGHNQPARLADGEFVVPARIVSELGNGSTEAGARKLYAMMDRVQKARAKTVGKDKIAANSRADKYLPS